MDKNDDVSDDFQWLDDPKYIAKVLNWGKLRFPFRPLEDADGNLLYKLYCQNGCCVKEISIAPNETPSHEKIRRLLDNSCEKSKNVLSEPLTNAELQELLDQVPNEELKKLVQWCWDNSVSPIDGEN